MMHVRAGNTLARYLCAWQGSAKGHGSCPRAYVPTSNDTIACVTHGGTEGDLELETVVVTTPR